MGLLPPGPLSSPGHLANVWEPLSLHLLLWLLPDLLFYPWLNTFSRKGSVASFTRILKPRLHHNLATQATLSNAISPSANGDNNNCKHVLNA